MNSNLSRTMEICETRAGKSFGSLYNFLHKRKLIKTLLFTIKENMDSNCKTLPVTFGNISVSLSKIFSKLNIQQLERFQEIAQFIGHMNSLSPMTSCIKHDENIFQSFDKNFVSRILWMGFRFSMLTDFNTNDIVKICCLKQNCLNPLHWSLMENMTFLNVHSLTSYENLRVFQSIRCNLQTEGKSLPTKIVSPNLSISSSFFIVYYQTPVDIEFESSKNQVWRELGICFYQIDDLSVVLYNFSDCTLFISSICMDAELVAINRSKLDFYVPVHKILPNRSIKVFSIDILESLFSSICPIPILDRGIITVQISFNKGWGKGYSRSSFIYCPRRCEISFKIPKSDRP